MSEGTSAAHLRLSTRASDSTGDLSSLEDDNRLCCSGHGNMVAQLSWPLQSIYHARPVAWHHLLCTDTHGPNKIGARPRNVNVMSTVKRQIRCAHLYKHCECLAEPLGVHEMSPILWLQSTRLLSRAHPEEHRAPLGTPPHTACTTSTSRTTISPWRIDSRKDL